MGKITKVPNGPLIKKKGVFKGSTLKNGGPMKKKAQTGMDVPKPKTGEHTGAPIGEYKPQGPPVGKYGGEGAPIGVSKYAKKGFKTGGKLKKAMLGGIMNMAGGKDNAIYKKTTAMRGKLGGAALGIPGMKPIVKNGSAIKKAQAGDTIYTKKDKVDNVRTNKYVVRLPNGSVEIGKETKTKNPNGKTITTKKAKQSAILGMKYTDDEIRKSMNEKKNGGMIKRADGSYSKRGLWDNIRANKGSGKKPTAAMLKQERKIKAKK